MAENDLSTKERSQIASKAQAQAHRVLRENHPKEYREAYQEAREQLLAKQAK